MLPVDEAPQDPSFFSFRARLIEAVARRDTAFLFAHTAPRVHVSYGAENGVEAFRRQWNLSSDPSESDVWPMLARVLGAGGRYQQGRFVAPYVYTDWPDTLDAFQHAAVMGEGVRVRATPSPESAVLTTLAFAIVPLAGEGGDCFGAGAEGWCKVRLHDTRVGYVAADYLYSPVGYRAGFEKRDGRWRMTFFIAGD